MEVDIFKMIYTKENTKKLRDNIKNYNNINETIQEEILNENYRILGHDFVKNNKNKAKLVKNNKKCELKEFINGKEFNDEQMKVKMILNKKLLNMSYLFQDCYELMGLSFDNYRINIYEERSSHFNEYYNDYNFYYIEDNINSNKSNFPYDHLTNITDIYKNLRTGDNHSIEYGTENESERCYNHNNPIITKSYIEDNIITYRCKYYTNLSYMFDNCINLLSLPDLSE